MNDNRQYFIVGLFITLGVVIGISVWLWFVANNHRDYNVYQTISTEPVDGIAKNTVVKYNGIEVGRVKALEIDHANPHNVIIYLNILATISINVQTYATLKPQGITGLSFVDLRLPDNVTDSINFTPHNTPPYPQIINKPSLLFNLTEQAQSLTNNLQNISSQTRILLSDENLQHISHTLNNFDKISTNLANKSDTLNKSIDTLLNVLQHIQKSSVQLNNTFDSFQHLSHSLEQTSNNTNKLILDLHHNTLQNINATLLPNINQMIINLNQTTSQLQQLLTALNQNPTILIRGKSKEPKGPGE